MYGMVFDTIASNTGHKTAACNSIQRVLDTPLLWLACRHHIGEVVLRKVWDALRVKCSKSQKITIYQRFQDNWGHLTHDDPSAMFFPVIEAELKQQAYDIVDLCRSLLNSKFIRCDYKELAELTVLYLTGDFLDGDFLV